ncbi:MAG: D-aminoacyl-tRNA deacylase [Candidatus Aerophobetes bacterium]|nr:D-aminoacyl-tRNA deacylase [Candidatus Aerophobetes bacterium]
MRVVIQRVRKALCQVDGETIGAVNKGMVVFLGIEKKDKLQDAEYLAEKLVNLRIFDDERGKMNLSLTQTKGEILIIPQFTLYGNCRKGLRPNFTEAAPPEVARRFYLKFIELVKKRIDKVENGEFGSRMRILVDNEGPVTLILDSKQDLGE